MAIRGPFEVVESYQMLYKRRIWHRQDRPRTVRLPFFFERKSVEGISGPNPVPWASVAQVDYFVSDAMAQSYQRAYTSFAKQLQEKAELAVALAEKKKSLEMLHKRVTQLLNFTNAIRKGRFGDAAAELGISLTPQPSAAQRRLWSKRRDKDFKWTQYPLRYPPRSARPEPSKAKSAADNYLEFWFGWKPVVQDIYQACKNLSDGIPPSVVRGRGSYKASNHVDGLPSFEEKRGVLMRCQIIADISVENPNSHLIAQLGFTNPATVLWEVIPWSFLLDWISNAGQFLTAFVGFPGLTVSNGATTYSSLWETEIMVNDYWQYTLKGKIVRCERTIFGSDVPLPPFVWKPLQFSPGRGGAAISLLLQRMRSLQTAKQPSRPRMKPGYYYRG